MRRTIQVAVCVVPAFIVCLGSSVNAETSLKIVLPLERAAYQTNEWIDVAVVRMADGDLAAGDLVVSLTAEDGGRMSFTFPMKASAAVGGKAAASEHLRLNGWLLRPGKYELEAATGGAAAKAEIGIHSHVRRSEFKTVDWSARSKDHEQAVLGEDSVGLNLIYAAYGGLNADEAIRGGLDYMWCCTMSGGAQMDLRRECDWSDPYVLGGGAGRLAERTFRDRTRPNCLGVHFYDEPTLTHLKHPVTGEDVPFNIPAQDRSYRAAFGREPILYQELKKDDPASVDQWLQMNRWRLSLLDAAWKLCEWPVNWIEPGYLTANQGSWLFSGYGAGYYFNYQRSLPIYSGHGGYDYLYSGHYAPGFFFEFGRARDYRKPQWYLPLWYDRHGDLFRAQQYMSFVCNLQGIAIPPDILMHKPSTMTCAGAVVESNKAMLRLGTVFTTMPPTKPPVAVLFSLSHNLDAMTRDPKDTYYGDYQWTRLLHVYLATKMIQVPIFAVVEEDVLDGTFERDHRVLILAGTKKLEPAVIRRLEAFIEAGGAVLASDDTAVNIKGMTRFQMDSEFLEGHKNWDRWAKEGKWDLWNTSVVTHAAYAAARSLAPVLKAKLDAAAKRMGTSFEAFECDQDGIVAGHEGKGEIDYYFAVNASPDFGSFGWYYLRGVEAEMKIPATDSSQMLYDAVLGGEAVLKRRGGGFAGTLRFGPGQMRAFARTARPIGGVQVTVSPVTADFTRCTVPQTAAAQEAEVTAVLVDDRGQILNGSAPLRVQVFDATGTRRQDLYRATDCGLFRMRLQLAANDPAGEWGIAVRELLSNREGRATLDFAPPRQCGAVAGQVQRALYFGRDIENIFRFFRVHKDMAILTGSSEYNSAQAQRLAEILKPWDVRCSIVSAADAAKPRELTDEQKPTWVGLGGGRGPDFAIEKPAILLGTPEDNPLIKFLLERGYLPYRPVKDQVPGRGRGMIAWQVDGIRFFGGESITLIAYDEPGMAEAVGTLFEAATGMEPLTPMALPADVTASPSPRGISIVDATRVPELSVDWQMNFPDWPVAMRALDDKRMVVLSDDGTLRLVQSNGKIAWEKTISDGEAWSMDVSASGDLIAIGTCHRIIGLNAKGKELFNVPIVAPGEDAGAMGKYPPLIEWVKISPPGDRVLASAGIRNWTNKWRHEGRLRMVSAKGETVWTQGGSEADPEKPPVLPEPIKHAIFTADGGKVILLRAEDAVMIDAATGKTEAAIAEINGGLEPLAWGKAGFIVSGGDGKLASIVALNGEFVKQRTLWTTMEAPKEGVASMAMLKFDLLLGTEADGAVRALARPQAPEGFPFQQALWQNNVYTKIVKSVKTDGTSRIAVNYWGGTVRVLSDNGKLLGERVFEQDITAMEWLGDRLIVGTADGRVVAMTMGT